MAHWGGQGHWLQRPQGTLVSVSSPGGPHFGTKTCPHSTTCRLQCWNASVQTTSQIGTQPHLSAERLPEVVLSLKPPLDTALPTRGKTPSSTHHRAGITPSHQEACISPWTNLTHQGTDTRIKRNYNPAACGKMTRNTEGQNEMTEKYVSDEGTR